MRVGILTGGGDAAGLNAAIRAVARVSLRQGHEVLGVINGWVGLMGAGETLVIDDRSTVGLLREGGTFLGSSRTNPLGTEDGLDQVIETMDALGIDGLVAIGGDDTLSVAAALAARGVAVVGIPKTVDYDLAVTEYCIGFDSAVAIVAEALDRLHTTAASHHRVMVCEVMGRDTGWLAVMGGIAGGADLVLIPEFPRSIDSVVEQISARRAAGLDSTIVVVAEGAEVEGLDIADEPSGPKDAFGHVALSHRDVGERLAAAIVTKTGFDSRATVLGHVQRGGSPVAADRIWPTRLGVAAADALIGGTIGVCAAVVEGTIQLVPLADLVTAQKRVPLELYEIIARVN